MDQADKESVVKLEHWSESTNSLNKVTSPVDMDQVDKESVPKLEHHESDVDRLQNNLPEKKNMVDKPKETCHGSKMSVDRSSLKPSQESEELQSLVDHDVDPDVILLEQFLTPKSITAEEQSENKYSPQQKTSLISSMNKKKWCQNQFSRDDEGETACLVNMLVAEIN